MKRFSTETDRVEAFSDGVFAVIITIMVLELRPPHGGELRDFLPALPTILVYALSFVFLGIYWNNHHHMLRASKGVDGRAMWANLHLLFWLSLVPFSTAWLGQNPTAVGPTVFYGIILFLDANAYMILQLSLLGVNGEESSFSKAVAVDVKGLASVALYLVAIVTAFFVPIAADALFVFIAAMWLVPDRRFEPLIDSSDRT